ncbi:hypothetical protein LSTR_LSTR007543 [Laodelphax striatellus]|uniref:SCP domain-containing protein n=1 Tax=Laodelphax striatellus TaxID=195883 RepID=A0A482XRD8_LAOST|nr:hypothetical protein LSTR_LSTR007543 [Laodelphax striatellus]
MVSMSMLVCHACDNGEIYDNTVTEEDITDVIEAHNLYRATVALGIGENLQMKWYGGPHTERTHNFTEAITSWYEEHVFYKYKTLEKGDSRDRKTQTGHYTQVVWANTNKVGCGFASFYQTEKQRDELLYVCNYAPTGNYEGEYPYIEGEPDCEANGLSKSDIDGLCKK